MVVVASRPYSRLPAYPKNRVARSTSFSFRVSTCNISGSEKLSFVRNALADKKVSDDLKVASFAVSVYQESSAALFGP